MTAKVEQTARHRAVGLGARDNLRYDLPAGLVVFLVALPLCLGIAFASGAPLIAGLIAGIVGGLVVAPLSKSSLAVSGPAAGLFVIVYDAIASLGSYEAFLTAVCIAGLLQLALGFVRAGIIAYYFPSSVIRGMLAGIGVVLILKQLPHAVGFNTDFEGDVFFFQADGRNTFTEIGAAFEHMHMGSTLIAVVGLAILVCWTRVPALARLRLLPPALVVVILGVALNAVARSVAPSLAVEGEFLVRIPDVAGLSGFLAELRSPDLSVATQGPVLRSAVVLAMVASIETLLCIEAIDKLDPFKRTTPTSHELKAQGVGNLVSGLLGGLPLTAVIVRGSANVQAGGRTWVAAFFQGILLLAALVAVPGLINQIPLAALAAILLHIGYKLASISLARDMLRQDITQSLPFFATVLGIVFTDLLTGVLVGLVIGIFFVLRAHVSSPFFLHDLSTTKESGHEHARVELSENVSFLNKAALNELLHSFEDGATVEIDARGTRHIDHDALEAIVALMSAAPLRGITVVTHGIDALLDEHGFRRPDPA